VTDRSEEIKSQIRELPDNDNVDNRGEKRDRGNQPATTINIDEFSGSMVININLSALLAATGNCQRCPAIDKAIAALRRGLAIKRDRKTAIVCQSERQKG
jgi:hypothetical protein